MSALQLLCCCWQLQLWPLLLQDPGLSASDAAALRGQLAAAQAQAQAAAAEAATLQQRLDSEATAAAGERQQLEARVQQLKAERRQLETDWEAGRVAAVEQSAAEKAEQKRAVADAKAARAGLESLALQVRIAEHILIVSRR